MNTSTATFRASDVRIVEGDSIWNVNMRLVERTLYISRVQGDVTNIQRIAKAARAWAKEKGYKVSVVEVTA